MLSITIQSHYKTTQSLYKTILFAGWHAYHNRHEHLLKNLDMGSHYGRSEVARLRTTSEREEDIGV